MGPTAVTLQYLSQITSSTARNVCYVNQGTSYTTLYVSDTQYVDCAMRPI